MPSETKAPSQEEANNKLVLKEALNKKLMDTLSKIKLSKLNRNMLKSYLNATSSSRIVKLTMFLIKR